MGTYGEALHRGSKAQFRPYRAEWNLHLQMRILVRKGRLLKFCTRLSSNTNKFQSLLLERRTLFIYSLFFILCGFASLFQTLGEGVGVLCCLLCFAGFFPRYNYTAFAKRTLLFLFIIIILTVFIFSQLPYHLPSVCCSIFHDSPRFSFQLLKGGVSQSFLAKLFLSHLLFFPSLMLPIFSCYRKVFFLLPSSPLSLPSFPSPPFSAPSSSATAKIYREPSNPLRPPRPPLLPCLLPRTFNLRCPYSFIFSLDFFFFNNYLFLIHLSFPNCI